MTRLEDPARARLRDPWEVSTLPFAGTIEVAETVIDVTEPSPCLPTASSVWCVLRPEVSGQLAVDLSGSTPHDAVVRIYRIGSQPAAPVFLGCASPVWNGQLSLEVSVASGETLLAQVGTSESRTGRLVVRAQLRP